MSKPHVEDYEPHEWIRKGEFDEEFIRDSSLMRRCHTPDDIVACNSESAQAADLGDHDTPFFFDHELISAGLPDDLEAELHRLGSDWGAHEEGKLVLIARTDETEFTVFLEE